jgi:hypothetical protein
VVVINPPNGKSHWQDERSQIGACEVRLPEMRLVDAAVKNSLSDRLRLLETLWQGDVVARIRLDGGKEKTLRCGEAVTGADGKPVAGLEHWTLSFANRGLAVFANGEEFATLRVRR